MAIQPITVPTSTAARPPGSPRAASRRRVQLTSTMPSETKAIHGTSQIWNAGRIEMKAIEMPASVPSIAARGVNLRMVGPTKAPISTMTPMMKAQARPGLPGQDRVVGLQVDRQHDHEDDDEHVRHARPVGHRRHVAAALLLASRQAR